MLLLKAHVLCAERLPDTMEAQTHPATAAVCNTAGH